MRTTDPHSIGGSVPGDLAPCPASPVGVRDPRIDILRGIALLTIVLNHVSLLARAQGYAGFETPTPTAFGYSSAAVLFVVMSGYMIGMVYLSKQDAATRLLKRARKLYGLNLLLFACLVPLGLFMDADMIAYLNLQTAVTMPLSGAVRFATTLYAPNLMDVLILYVQLMLVAPLFVLLLRRSPWLMLAVSVALYLLAQPSGPLEMRAPEIARWLGADIWTYHPLAWQLPFFGSMLLGRQRRHIQLFAFFEHRSWWLRSAIAMFAGVAVLVHLQLHGYVPKLPYVLVDKETLGVVRLLHVMLVVFIYAGLLARFSGLLDTVPGRAVAAIGRHSLTCFFVSVVLIYLAALAWPHLGSVQSTYLIVTAVSVAVVVLAARYQDSKNRLGSMVASKI